MVLTIRLKLTPSISIITNPDNKLTFDSTKLIPWMQVWPTTKVQIIIQCKYQLNQQLDDQQKH